MGERSRDRKWRASQFNEYLGELRKNNWVIYNNLSGAMIEVTKELFDFIRSNNVAVLPKPEYYKALSHGKFIIEENIDEVEELKKRKNELNESVSVIGLQIVPTLQCNFKCTYCYENAPQKMKLMPPEVMDAIIAYVTRKIKSTTRYLNVIWFGGEPFLAVDRIQYLSEAFLKIADKNDIQYFAGIVTNGYLLNKKNLEILLENKINNCQVTIDGPQQIHDRRRMLKNGGKTWLTIINNVKNAISKGMNINIRMNLDKTNIDSTKELLVGLKENQILDYVKISFGIVSSFNSVCRSIEHNLLTHAQVNEILKKNKIEELLKKAGEELTRPVPDFVGCVANARHSIIVGPEGELYKCSKNIGQENETCGTIFHLPEEHPNFKKWLTCDNLDVANCQKCSLLPICKGNGCPFKFVIEKKNIFDCNKSVIHRHYLNKLISLYEQKRST